MASFRDDPADLGRLDYRLLQNGPIALYWRAARLEADRTWLTQYGYRVVSVDCGTWSGESDLHHALGKALAFPTYYGRNLNALGDVLSDVAMREEGGLALILDRFDRFVRAAPELAATLLDVLTEAARRQLLFGRRLLILARSDDPALELPPVGAMPVVWNPAEWLSASREGKEGGDPAGAAT